MLKRFLVCVAASALLAAPVSVSCQMLDSLTSGQRVRVWTRQTGTEAVQAFFVELTADTVVFRAPKMRSVLRIPRDSVWRLDVQSGRSRVPGSITGATLGLIAGGVGGWAVSTLAGLVFEDCGSCKYGPLPSEHERWEEEDRRIARQVGVAGAALGIVGGAFIGSRYLGYRWRPVPLSPRVGLRVLPSTSAYAASLSVEF